MDARGLARVFGASRVARMPRIRGVRGIVVGMPARAPVPPEQWTDPRHRRGLDGEQLARAYLERLGWVIEAHRFRLGRLELDLVARRGSVVAFVEVKTRCSSRYGSPGEAVGWRKRRSLARVASAWILRHGSWGEAYRFDVVEVFVGFGGRREVRHVEGAWRL
jgi:putative endonuclease